MRRLFPAFLLLAPLLATLSLPPAAALAQTFCDYPPGVSVSATRGAVGVAVFVQITASDPNGDAITSLTADTSGLPPGNNAVFTSNAGNTAGTLTWTPQPGQTGNFTVTYTAVNSLSRSTPGTISVTDTGGAPFVQCPATLLVNEGWLVTFDVLAADPDGEPIASLTAAPLPPGATFTANPTNTMGTFTWQTGFASGGFWSVTFTAANSLSGSSTTGILVTNLDRGPFVNAPPTAVGTEGSLLTICTLASDPDGDAIVSLTASPLPSGATFTASPTHQAGTFEWTPAPGQAGTYNVTFTASNSLAGQATTQITINPAGGDRPPVVNAPASASGSEGSPLTVLVTASDPDGDAITSLTAAPLPAGATFTTGAGFTAGTLAWTPASGQAGTYFVSFVASNALSAAATTALHVLAVYPARVFTTGGNKAIHLGSNRPLWCANVEPVNASFAVTDVLPSSVVMISPGTGSVSQISAVQGKTSVVGDQDNNSIQDVEICFLKGDLRLLFSGITGRQTVTVTVEGSLVSGARFRGTLTVDVFAGGGGGALAAVVTPNPPGRDATLRFTTLKAGAVRVRIFDVSGRLVRSLVEDSYRAAGDQVVRFDGRGEDGRRLASGVYLFRVDATEGIGTGRIAILH